MNVPQLSRGDFMFAKSQSRSSGPCRTDPHSTSVSDLGGICQLGTDGVRALSGHSPVLLQHFKHSRIDQLPRVNSMAGAIVQWSSTVQCNQLRDCTHRGLEIGRSPSTSHSFLRLAPVLRSRVAKKTAKVQRPTRALRDGDNKHGGSSTSVKETSSSNASSSSSSSFLTFLCPLLKLIGGGDPSAPRNTFLETATTGLASMARLPWGSQVLPEAAAARSESGQPSKNLQLYEFEACPFCRRVREALTELDLSVEVFPCPKGSLRHREFVRSKGGKDQFPFFLDPNTGVALYESSDIVKYLFQEYGAGRQPSPGLLESTLVTGWVPTLVRAGRGMTLFQRAPQQPPEKLLELYSYENNQFARLVREALCELELPYLLRNAGKGSSLRPALLQLAGSTQVPYLVDPNTGVRMAESKDIIAYLFKTYGPVSA